MAERKRRNRRIAFDRETLGLEEYNRNDWMNDWMNEWMLERATDWKNKNRWEPRLGESTIYRVEHKRNGKERRQRENLRAFANVEKETTRKKREKEKRNGFARYLVDEKSELQSWKVTLRFIKGDWKGFAKGKESVSLWKDEYEDLVRLEWLEEMTSFQSQSSQLFSLWRAALSMMNFPGKSRSHNQSREDWEISGWDGWLFITLTPRACLSISTLCSNRLISLAFCLFYILKSSGGSLEALSTTLTQCSPSLSSLLRRSELTLFVFLVARVGVDIKPTNWFRAHLTFEIRNSM